MIRLSSLGRFILSPILFAFILLFSFGYSADFNYIIAPYLLFLELIIMIVFRSKIIINNVFLVLLSFSVLSSFSSVNYFYFDLLNGFTCSYMEYYSNFISIFFAPICIFILCRSNDKLINDLFYYGIIFFILGVYRYFRSESQMEVLGVGSLQNNMFYFVLMPLPFILLYKNNILKITGTIFTFIVCFLSFKRSAIIAISVIVFVYFLYDSIINRNKLSIYFILSLLLIGPFLSDFNWFSNFDLERMLNRFINLREDRGSGRLDIINDFMLNDLDEIFEFPYFIFGYGYGAINNKYKIIMALHNDWLETLYSYGFIGFILLFTFVLYLIRRLVKLYSEKSSLFVSYFSGVFLFIFYSFTGGNLYFVSYSLILFFYFGVVEYMVKYNIIHITRA